MTGYLPRATQQDSNASTRLRVGPSGWLEIVLNRVARRPVLEDFGPWSRPTITPYSPPADARVCKGDCYKEIMVLG